MVLIDDLDRCSPDRIVENLEAIRLFLNVEKTALDAGKIQQLVHYSLHTLSVGENRPREIRSLVGGDVRVLARLLAKEHAAHTALGDAASLMRLHDVGSEEEEIRRALADRRPLDEVVPDPTPLDQPALPAHWPLHS